MSIRVVSKFYDWQIKIINHRGNITIRGGRQSGKSEAVAERIYHNAINHPGERSLIIAASERQENYIYETVRDKIGNKYKGRSTLTKVVLENGHEIYKFPVGKTGIYLEGLSDIAFLYCDEAMYIFEKVWDSILPMLAKPRARGLGWITLLSSTRGKPKGYFFDSFSRDDFEKVQIHSEDCPHISKDFLAEEKIRLGERMFNVIYGGEFDAMSMYYFPEDHIDRQIKFNIFTKKEISPFGEYYLGIDPARYGKSKAAFAISQRRGKVIRVIYGEEHKETDLLDLKKITLKLDTLFKTRKVLIDDGGLGQGLIDFLKIEKKFKRKLRPINNSASGRDGKILKEDLYSNLLNLLASGELELVNQEEIIKGLKGVTYEGAPGDERIIGTDMSEAVARAVWGASKERYIKPTILRF